MSDEHSTAAKPGPSLIHRLIGAAGLVLYLVVGWFYLASGLVVPFPWFIVLWVIWAGGLFVLVKLFREAPTRTVLVPLAAAGIWVLFVQLGSWLLGWTA